MNKVLNNKKLTPKSNNFHQKPKQNFIKSSKNQGKSLLQKISSQINSSQKQNHQGKLIITKLNDYVEYKCLYGINCAHLRAQSKCQFLHEKKDYEGLSIPLPDKYLQNEQPLKKSKQQRKQDKIKQKAERQQRLKQKYERQQKRQKAQQHKQKQQDEELLPAKVIQQKHLDKKQLLIQRILKIQSGQKLNLDHIYQQLNLITSAISKKQNNIYSQQFNLTQMNFTLFEIRKRLLLKLKKNKQFQQLLKWFVNKQNAIIIKIIKNIFNAYKEMVQSIQSLEKCQCLDLRQIQSKFTNDDVNRVLNLKKDHQSIIQYYSRFFSQTYGFPISFQSDEQGANINKGGMLPLVNYEILPIISSTFKFSRIFLSLDISFAQLRGLSEFSSLINPQKISQKMPVQKTFTLDISQVTYGKFVEQIMTQYLTDYHQKMKGPAKQFQFGKMEQNLKKFRNFIAKYKAKIESQNKQNTFILVVYHIKKLLQKIQILNLNLNLNYDSIKQDRSLEEQNTYEKIFLLRQFINIIGQKSQQKLKVIYINNGKKLKFKKYQSILSSIDQGLLQKGNQQKQVQKMQQQ